MASPSVKISDLRINDQALAFGITIDPADATGKGMMVIHDASGTERSRTDLGELTGGQLWNVSLELPAEELRDGDFAAWVHVFADGDGDMGSDEKGISFLVGRGRVYPSREAAPRRETEAHIEVSGLRVDGSWVVFDMTNAESYDVSGTYDVLVGPDGGPFHEFHGEELIQAKATQQGHYLLPEVLVDGTYLVSVVAHAEGSDYTATALITMQVSEGVITVLG